MPDASVVTPAAAGRKRAARRERQDRKPGIVAPAVATDSRSPVKDTEIPLGLEFPEMGSDTGTKMVPDRTRATGLVDSSGTTGPVPQAPGADRLRETARAQGTSAATTTPAAVATFRGPQTAREAETAHTAAIVHTAATASGAAIGLPMQVGRGVIVLPAAIVHAAATASGAATATGGASRIPAPSSGS